MDLWKYRNVLEFVEEHRLTVEPMRIDLLVIKKREDAVIEKSIARAFRRHNIMEYKNPRVGVSVNDFHKAISYVFQYIFSDKNDAGADDVTFTFVAGRYARGLFEYIERVWGCKISAVASGVMATRIGPIPFQFVESRSLSEEGGLWLSSLNFGVGADKLERVAEAFPEEGAAGGADGLSAYMRAVANANPEAMKEVFTEMRKKDTLYKILIDTDFARDMISEGEARGEARGEVKSALNIARRMLTGGLSVEDVLRFTGLSREQLREGTAGN
jgi:hypothetical protein